MIVVNFGGGKNSTALVIEAVRRGIVPDLLLFADTGGEKPETYRHIERFNLWLAAHNWPTITTVRATLANGATTLEEECAIDGVLPSKAFGFSRCSSKWKIRPQEYFLRERSDVQAIWAMGGRVECWVGFHADETARIARQRLHDAHDKRYYHRHPLNEWDIGQKECLDILISEGFHEVEKYSCFFCPNMKKWEIRRLEQQHPDLMARALAMEAKAQPNLRSVAGLGRSFAWADYLRQPELAFGSCSSDDEGACDSCYDGE